MSVIVNFRLGKSVLITVLFSFFLGACTQFFSTSLAPWAARDPETLIPEVNAGNVDELIRKTRNNPEMSLVVLKRIRSASENAQGNDLLALQQAAVQAASNATGIASSLISQAGNISGIDNKDDAIGLIESSLASMKNLGPVADNLNDILPDPVPGNPEWENFVNNSSADDLAIVAVLLLAGEAKKDPGGVEDYINNKFEDNKTNSTLTSQEALALALVEEALNKSGSSGLSDSLKALAEGLKLTP